MLFRAQPGAYHRRLRSVAEKAKRRQQLRADVSKFTVPDLLHEQPFLSVDGEMLLDLLGLGFLGKDLGGSIQQTLAGASTKEASWAPDFFADDLFLSEFAQTWSQLRIDGVTYPANRPFLVKTLAAVPVDRSTIEMRQGILRELDEKPELNERFHELYKAVAALLRLFETPGYQGSLDTAAIHLEILGQAKSIIDRMSDDFADTKSGLRRIHLAGEATRSTEEYEILRALLEYESGMATLALEVRVGGDGRIRSVNVEAVEENGDNPFHAPLLQRMKNRLRLLAGGYDFTNKELMKRMVNEVFDQLSPSLIPLIQLLGHLEVYISNLQFREEARARGLHTSLADLDDSQPLRVEELFNPLLLTPDSTPVPCSFGTSRSDAITIVTGPNSGGKTRLLQALAWAQLLGQSGLYTACRRVRLPILNGLFVSLVETESADQTEGRLGRELVRVRSLFEEIQPRSLVVLDELCSGTNPSEGVEVFALVLELLRQVDPTAFVTTHFLDFARSMRDEPPIAGLEFLQVELDKEQVSTYQFVPGVAPTSLAALTASRLGVTFERLSTLLADRESRPAAATGTSAEDEIDEAAQ